MPIVVLVKILQYNQTLIVSFYVDSCDHLILPSGLPPSISTSGVTSTFPPTEPVYAGTGTARAWSPLGSEAALREAASLPLARWRAPAIIAWLELALGMPQYAAAVADNVKSGKVSTVHSQ